MAFNPPSSPLTDHYFPLGADQHVRRDVESIFIRAPFHNPNSDLVIVALDWS
jgi:hypothetical protein